MANGNARIGTGAHLGPGPTWALGPFRGHGPPEPRVQVHISSVSYARWCMGAIPTRLQHVYMSWGIGGGVWALPIKIQQVAFPWVWVGGMGGDFCFVRRRAALINLAQSYATTLGEIEESNPCASAAPLQDVEDPRGRVHNLNYCVMVTPHAKHRYKG